MKKRLMELKTLMTGLEIPVADRYKLILLNYNLYSCFRLAVEEEIDLDEYKMYLSRALLYYLSSPFTSYENRIGFVKSFYESYVMFDQESIITSVTDPTSILFDDSLESFLARALAIADAYQMHTCRLLFDELEETLQKTKNVI